MPYEFNYSRAIQSVNDFLQNENSLRFKPQYATILIQIPSSRHTALDANLNGQPPVYRVHQINELMNAGLAEKDE